VLIHGARDRGTVTDTSRLDWVDDTSHTSMILCRAPSWIPAALATPATILCSFYYRNDPRKTRTSQLMPLDYRC
jgi:hypothetical protein